jgi:hypothetical protein
LYLPCLLQALLVLGLMIRLACLHCHVVCLVFVHACCAYSTTRCLWGAHSVLYKCLCCRLNCLVCVQVVAQGCRASTLFACCLNACMFRCHLHAFIWSGTSSHVVSTCACLLSLRGFEQGWVGGVLFLHRLAASTSVRCYVWADSFLSMRPHASSSQCFHAHVGRHLLSVRSHGVSV